MKRTFLPSIVIMLAAFLVIGCLKDDNQVEWHPEDVCDTSFKVNRFPLPPAKRYDLNADGIDDVEIFQDVKGISASKSESRIVSQLSSLNVNRTQWVARTGYIEAGDEIQFSGSWIIGSQSLMRVGGCRGLYEDLWTPSMKPSERVFAAVIIFQKGNTYLAWIEVQRDFRTGEAEIIDSDFTRNSSIVIGEH